MNEEKKYVVRYARMWVKDYVGNAVEWTNQREEAKQFGLQEANDLKRRCWSSLGDSFRAVEVKEVRQ